jgi:glycosyltransferase involved in cell wall biosynthesis
LIWQLVDSSGLGGIERHVEVLTRGLIDRGYATKVVLLADHGPHLFLERLRYLDIPVQVLPGGFQKLYSALRAYRPSRLHTHGYKAGIFGRIAAMALRVPVVSSFHAGERGAFPVSLYQWIDEWTGTLVPRIAVSRAVAAALPGQPILIENFLSIPDKSVALARSRTIAFVGRLSHEKGPDLFCQIASARQNIAQWHIYGDGPMRASLELEYGHCVKFHGMVSTLEAVWPSIGLLLMPSRAEGLPMAALEAMASGVPVIASAVGGLPDLITQGVTGWLVDAGSTSGFMNAVDTAIGLSDASYQAVSDACRCRIERDYNAEQGIDRILALYGHGGLEL